MTQNPAYSDRPTRVRFGVLGFVCSLSMITYLDRVCISSAGSALVREFNLKGIEDLGPAFTAFIFSYAIFEVPTGWLGDVFGPRKTLIRIVLWWSVFTALTGVVGLAIGSWIIPMWVLVVIRFLFGVGEAGAYPNLTRALHNWFPYAERGMVQGAMWMAGRLMGGLTPLVWMLVVERWELSWRAAFWIFGGIGVIWCVAFAYWFRNRPEEKPEVNEAERKWIGALRVDTEAAHTRVPWLKLLTSSNLWALCLMYFCAAYGWYFNITYLPNFLEEQYGVEPKSVVGALYKGGPLWMGAITCLVGGWLTDLFIRRTGRRKWGRRIFGLVGHGLCALCYLVCITGPDLFYFFLAISLAAFWNDLTMGSAWAVCQDIGRRHAAIVAGCMNTIGNLGGTAAGAITALILNHHLKKYAQDRGIAEDALTLADRKIAHDPAYLICFVIFAAVYVIAVLLWLRIDSTKPIVPDEPAPTGA